MIRRQLQLRLKNQSGLRSQGRSGRRSGRAHWWFEKMRGIVDHAPDWPPTAPSPEVTPSAATTPPPASEAKASPAPPPYRWKFSRARQVRWE